MDEEYEDAPKPPLKPKVQPKVQPGGAEQPETNTGPNVKPKGGIQQQP